MGKVTSVNISDKKGVRKHKVEEINLKIDYGIENDAHAGNWHRQISLLGDESVDKVRKHIPGITPGAFAENINTKDIILYELPVGTKISIGNSILEVTQIGKQCHDQGCAIKKATGDCVMPREGIFAIVIQEGTIKTGDEINIL